MGDGVQSLTRALGILETLAPSSDGLWISELSRKARRPASTIHRLLSNRMISARPAGEHDLPYSQFLGGNGYVIQLNNKKHRLGHKLIQFGRNFLDSSHLTKSIRPYYPRGSLSSQ